MSSACLIPTEPTARGVTIIVQRLAYSTEEAAAMIGICRQEISRLIHEGRLPARRYGRRVLVTHDALVEFLSRLPAACVVEAATDGPCPPTGG